MNILKKKYWILLIVIILIILVTTIRFNVFNSTDILFKKLPVKAQVLLLRQVQKTSKTFVSFSVRFHNGMALHL